MKNTFCVSAENFKKIPGSPIAYWVGEKIGQLFATNESVNAVISLREGMHTGKNELFLRDWTEVSINSVVLNATNFCDVEERGRWVPYNKGGGYRKWYGNNTIVVRADRYGLDLMSSMPGHVRPSQSLYFKKGATWSAISSGKFGLRYYPDGFLFDSKGQVAVGDRVWEVLVLLNTSLYQFLADVIMPTLDYKCGDVKKLPFLNVPESALEAGKQLVTLSRSDWNEYETSWDFKVNPLVREGWQRSGAAMKLEAAWAAVFARRLEWVGRMKTLEEENNRLFIEAYGLQDELKPDVEWKDVSITGNPAYRYKLDGDPQSGEELARADAMRELISYGMGVLMGRYSLEQEGLILASQGELYKDYIARVHGAGKILPDEDGVIPAIALEGGFFKDNLLHRMREFLSAAFGNDALPQNLNYIEATLGCGFDKYLTDKFFDDHVKTYKKRPIYWLFESPKGYFRAFAYMHRMTGATAGHIRNNYLLPYIGHLEKCFAAEVAKGSSMTSAERKRVKAMEAAIKDCKAYDLVLHDFADRAVAIDLDDGVVVNWKKYESVLAKL